MVQNLKLLENMQCLIMTNKCSAQYVQTKLGDVQLEQELLEMMVKLLQLFLKKL